MAIPQKHCKFANSNSNLSMKVAIVQHDIVWAQPTENLRHLSQLLDRQSEADLYVLAETFTTGFMAKGNETTDISHGLTWLQQQAKEKDAVFAASIATKDEDGSLRNRLFFVRPDGTYDYYDKHHLFSYAGETDAYVAGQERVIVEWRGIRFLLQVCYDLRFPCFSRNNEKIPYDCALYVGSWPTSRLAVWDTLLHARAIENQCYVAGVNRIGEDQSGRYSGGTLIVDHYGNTMAACPLGEDSAITVELDLQKLKEFRRKFPVLKDADGIF